MYKEIFASLEEDYDLYYKIKNEEEAEWFANELLNHGYSNSRDEFLESFDKGRDCLSLYKGYEYRDHLLTNEDIMMSLDKVRCEPTKTIVNPTYDDLKPLFSDTKPKEVEDVDLDIALEYDTVERPKHYNVFEKEVIYTIKDLLDNNNNYKGFDNYCIGNSLKYIFRAGLKGNYYEDLEKARYYINKILEGKE